MTHRILVCGSRHTENNKENYFYVRMALNKVVDDRKWWYDEEYQMVDAILIHGASPVGGIDWIADDWALDNWLVIERYPPLRDDIHMWGFATAAKMRNQRMLDEGKPDLVVAFKGGNGTADMVQRAKVQLGEDKVIEVG